MDIAKRVLLWKRCFVGVLTIVTMSTVSGCAQQLGEKQEQQHSSRTLPISDACLVNNQHTLVFANQLGKICSWDLDKGAATWLDVGLDTQSLLPIPDSNLCCYTGHTSTGSTMLLLDPSSLAIERKIQLSNCSFPKWINDRLFLVREWESRFSGTNLVIRQSNDQPTPIFDFSTIGLNKTIVDYQRLSNQLLVVLLGNNTNEAFEWAYPPKQRSSQKQSKQSVKLELALVNSTKKALVTRITTEIESENGRVQIAPGGTFVIVHTSREIEMRKAPDLQLVSKLALKPPYTCSRIASTSNGKMVVFGDSQLQLWLVESNKVVSLDPLHNRIIMSHELFATDKLVDLRIRHAFQVVFMATLANDTQALVLTGDGCLIVVDIVNRKVLSRRQVIDVPVLQRIKSTFSDPK